MWLKRGSQLGMMGFGSTSPQAKLHVVFLLSGLFDTVSQSYLLTTRVVVQAGSNGIMKLMASKTWRRCFFGIGDNFRLMDVDNRAGNYFFSITVFSSLKYNKYFLQNDFLAYPISLTMLWPMPLLSY
jgi:hypothetical protein